MNKEQVLDLMSNLPADLVEEADVDRPVKRRLPKLARTSLIAACLCLALAGTAFAAVRYFWVEVFSNEKQIGYKVYGELVKYPVDQFSAQLLADCRSWNGENLIQPKFDTWEETKAYLGGGIPCVWPENVLPNRTGLYQPPIHLCLWQDRENENRLGAVQAFYYGRYIDSETGRWIEPSVEVYIATEYFPSEQMDPSFEGSIGGTLYTGSAYKVEQLEDYLMPNGATAGIVMTEYPLKSGLNYECIANFVKDGIRYQVSTRDIGYHDGPAAILSDLKTILDLFP